MAEIDWNKVIQNAKVISSEEALADVDPIDWGVVSKKETTFNERKKALIDEMYGLLEGVDMTLEELKENRLKKYKNPD